MNTDETSAGCTAQSSSDDSVRSGAAWLPGIQTETLLTTILKEVLRLPDVDLTRHFVDVGGDSLAAGELSARLSESLGIDISPILPFEANNLQDLAARIDHIRQSARGREPGKEKGSGRERGTT